MRKGEFRQDLFYRINVISVTQPPLRERMGDIPLLVDYYVKQFNEQTGKHIHGFHEDALHLLQQYRWPGNVRELVNVVERAVVLAKTDLVTVSDLPEAIRSHIMTADVAGHLNGGSLKSALANPERQIIIEALESNGWNRQDTAKLLGINRTTLYKKMKKYDISFEKRVGY